MDATLGGHGNRFVTTEPQFQHLKSSGVKFMNHFIDFKNPPLKSFGSYNVAWVNGNFLPSKASVTELLFGKILLKSYI